MDESTSILTTIDSIERFNCLELSEYVLFLDEFNSLIEYIFMADRCLTACRAVHVGLLHQKLQACGSNRHRHIQRLHQAAGLLWTGLQVHSQRP
eukprot:m.367000 g.367000  ORF g.367000 m.367000 type:complete len:94 (-) comp28097_c0_seq12:2225-2506(-)